MLWDVFIRACARDKIEKSMKYAYLRIYKRLIHLCSRSDEMLLVSILFARCASPEYLSLGSYWSGAAYDGCQVERSSARFIINLGLSSAAC